jgi:hypothetical protein
MQFPPDLPVVRQVQQDLQVATAAQDVLSSQLIFNKDL